MRWPSWVLRLFYRGDQTQWELGGAGNVGREKIKVGAHESLIAALRLLRLLLASIVKTGDEDAGKPTQDEDCNQSENGLGHRDPVAHNGCEVDYMYQAVEKRNGLVVRDGGDHQEASARSAPVTEGARECPLCSASQMASPHRPPSAAINTRARRGSRPTSPKCRRASRLGPRPTETGLSCPRAGSTALPQQHAGDKGDVRVPRCKCGVSALSSPQLRSCKYDKPLTTRIICSKTLVPELQPLEWQLLPAVRLTL